MLTKELYKEEYIRMMDSLRQEYPEALGQANCDYVHCFQCPLKLVCNGGNSAYNAFEVIEIVDKWSKAHPYVRFGVLD